ncbi:MAG: DUF2125 domain-containing protein [Hyphomonadaceae bacterium]|nr:DUF2125 domain-containing protein [Hyphomonadaceae bacterium]
MSAAKPRRLGLIIPWALFALACAGWTAFWFSAKDHAIARLDSIIVAAKARGVDAHYDGVRASGFPLHLKLNLANVRVSTAVLPLVEARTLPVAINLVDPSHVIVDLKDGVRWTGRDGVAHLLDPVRGALSLHWDDATLKRASLDLEGAPTRKLLAHLRPDPRAANAFQLALVLEGVDDEALRAGMVIDHADVLLRSDISVDPLKPWIDSGGRVRVEAIDLRWKGATLTGSGDFALDARRRPEGAVQLKAEGDSVAVLTLLGALDPAAADTATLSAQDGVWRLGQATHPVAPLYDLPSPP